MPPLTSTVEDVRRANTSRILTLLHREGPRARSALTEATGLNRSTVGALVGDLAGAGLVHESPPDGARRVGRPSPIASASSGVVAIAVNPEVDAITVAAVGLDRSVLSRERIEADHLITPDEAVDIVADCLAGWRSGALAHTRIVGLGVAAPGIVRSPDGVIRDAPHLRWTEVAFERALADATGLPTRVSNDATLGALAENLFGAARGADDALYLNGGASGIGGGIILGGRLIGGAGGYAGEFGHTRVAAERPVDRRTDAAILEDEVSRTRLLSALGLSGGDERALAAAIARARTVDAEEEIARQRRILATALAGAVNLLNPSVIVLGGFLSALAERDLTGFEDDLRRQALAAHGEALQVRPADLGEDRLLIGAAEAAFAPLLSDPLGTVG